MSGLLLTTCTSLCFVILSPPAAASFAVVSRFQKRPVSMKRIRGNGNVFPEGKYGAFGFIESSHESTTVDEPTTDQHFIASLRRARVEKETKTWIIKVICGLSLCPFAEKPLKQNRLKVDVVLGDDECEIGDVILSEMLRLKNVDGTSVVVTPDFNVEDFGAFLDFVGFIEREMMEAHSLHGDIQIVPFHPKFEFEGSEDSVDNYTNRSPFPAIHILREDEVSRAVDTLDGDASTVWKRNVQLLHTLEHSFGRKGVESIMKGKFVKGAADLIHSFVSRSASHMNDLIL